MLLLKGPQQRPGRGASSVLETLNVDTGKRTLLAEFPDVIEAPNWTKDGKYLVYNGGGRLWRYEIATGKSTQIDTGFCTSCNNDHVLSSDNKHIALSHFTKEDGQSRIYIVPFEGGAPTLVTPLAPSFLHGWSPDGKTLAYHGERSGWLNINAIPAAGGEETKLTDNCWLDDGPEYSPDGKYIWFNSTRSGLMQVWRMKADGSEQTQMTFSEQNNWFPHPSPNNERVVYISFKKGDVEPDRHPPNREVALHIMSTKGGDSKKLIDLFGGQGTINVNSWSPDNQTIAFVSYKLK
jgi:Tol biopolymer transport system component